VPATFLLGFGFGGFERSLDAIAPDDDDTFGNLEKASLAASGTLLVSSVYGLVQVGRCRGSRARRGGPEFARRHVRPLWAARRASPPGVALLGCHLRPPRTRGRDRRPASTGGGASADGGASL
jgi:hypothetical protein